MKKIMLAVVIGCVAAFSNAAQMKWGSGTMKMPGSTTNLSGATVKLFSLTASEYSSLSTAISEMSVADAQAKIYGSYSGEEATLTSSTWSKGANTITENTTYAAGDTAYAVLIYSKTVDEVDYYIANMGTWSFEADATKTMGNMGTKFLGTGDALAWQNASAVPEPTSGLLFLLGMAGLALKRKHA